MLIIEWKTEDWNGGKDFLPSHWFSEEGKWSFRSHTFQSPRGRRFTARCSVKVKGPVAEMNYGGEHTAYNEADADIGILKLTFASEGRLGDPTVEWRDAKRGDIFRSYNVEIRRPDYDKGPPPSDVPNQEDCREKVERSVIVRRGQPAFRDALMDAYERRCAISGCEIEEVLEAAHINPFKGAHSHRVTNGLLLRADIHTLFDVGLITVNRDYSIDAPDHIRRALNLLKRLILPANPAHHPDRNAFAQKWADD